MPRSTQQWRFEPARRLRNPLVQPHLSRRRRWGPLRFIALGITAAIASGSVLLLDASEYRTVSNPGHGRGMSQNGALRNAQDGWPADRILAHYYPGATLGSIGPTTVSVRLMGRDNAALDVSAEAGARVAGRELAPGQAAHLRPLPDGGANVVVTAGCSGEVLWQEAVSDPWVYPLDPSPNRPASEHLTLCGGGGYRGSLGVAEADSGARTVNRVDVQDYLRGVVPAEVQANWADQGATEAVRAQAITARSYALAEQRYPYAQTCDTDDCQVYTGTAEEDERSTAAVDATEATVLLRDGHILRTEYSAAPDGGRPADIRTFEIGPTPADLEVATPGSWAAQGELSSSHPDESTPPESTPAAPDGVQTEPAGTPAADVETLTNPASSTESPLDSEYARIGGPESEVGPPIGPTMKLPTSAGSYRMHRNGIIVHTQELGARVVDFSTLLQLAPDAGQQAEGAASQPGQQPQGQGLAIPTESEVTGRPSPDDPVAAEPQGRDLPALR